jgi:hypothetical protein
MARERGPRVAGWRRRFAAPPSIVRAAGTGVAGSEKGIITGRGPERPDPWDLGWVRNVVENGLIQRLELP